MVPRCGKVETGARRFRVDLKPCAASAALVMAGVRIRVWQVATLLGFAGRAVAMTEATTEDLGYGIRHWSLDEGLPTAIVTSLAQTPDGFLWVGNFAALARFDGVRFRRHGGGFHPDLAGAEVYELATGGDGRLWVRGYEGLLGYLSEGRFHPLGEDEGMPRAGADKIGPGPDGRLCFRGNDGAFYRWSGERVWPVPVTGIAAGEVDVLAMTDEGLWMVHEESRRLWHAPAEGWGAAPADIEGAPEDLAFGRFFHLGDGSMALNSNYGVYRFSKGAWSGYRTLEAPIVRHRGMLGGAQTPDGTLWLGTYPLGVLALLSDGGLRRVRLDPPAARYARSLLADDEGNLWIGNNNGLYRLRPMPVTSYSVEEGLRHPNILSVATSGGELWTVGGGGLFRFDPEADHFRQVDLRPWIEPTHVSSLGNGAALVGGTIGHVFEVDEGGGRLLGKIPGWVKALCRDEQDTTWVAGKSRLWRLGEDGEAHRVEIPGAPHEQEVLELKLDESDRPVIHFANGERFAERDEGWERVGGGDLDGGLRVRQVLSDPDHGVWAIDQRGEVARRTRGRWEPLPGLNLDEGISLNGLAFDGGGHLWLASSAGIIRIDRRRLESPRSSGGVRRYFEEDGLDSVVLRGGARGIAMGRDGRVWFATLSGLASIDTVAEAKRRAEAPAPRAFIERVEVDAESVDLGGSVEIPATASHLEIEFTGTRLGEPGHGRFRYRLAGYRDEWIDGGRDRRVGFLRPPAGEYRFELQAVSSDGILGPTLATVPLEVAPLWWERGWVRALGVLLACGAVGGIGWWRFRLLKREAALQESLSRRLIGSQEEERKRIAQELHDSLGQELLVLNAHAERTARKHPELGGELEKQSQRILSAIEETRRIAYGLRPPHLETIGLGPMLEGLAEELDANTAIEVEAEVDPIEPRLDAEAEINLYRIAQEALANAIRHSGAERVVLRVFGEEGEVILRVVDDGHGLRLAGGGGGSLGLSGMEQRARIIGGHFRVGPMPDGGTRVEVRVPRTGGSA